MEEMLARYEQDIIDGRVTSFAAAGKLLELYDKMYNK
jgi:hypothetical protein